MAFKILLTGSFKSGKSTLASLLRQQGIFVIDEIASPILEDARQKGDTELKRRPGFQLTLLEKQLAAEAEAEIQHGVVVCDRGIPDIVVYSKYYGHQFDWQTLLCSHNPYDKIFLCLIDGIDVENRFSSADLEKRASLQKLFSDTFDELRLPYILLSGSVETRLNGIQEVLYPLLSREGGLRGIEH